MRHENKEGSDTLQAPCLFSFFRLPLAQTLFPSAPTLHFSPPPFPLGEWHCLKWMYFHFISGKARAKLSCPVVVHSILVDYFETFRLLYFWYS
jgi:hypothetical protein